MKRGRHTMRAARLRYLDTTSRQRALSDLESRELERLLHADYCARLRCDQPISRGSDIGRAYPPTARQMELLRFICGHFQAKGYAPSVREMAAGIGHAGLQTIVELLDGLEGRGLIHRLPRRARALEVLAPIPVPHAPDGRPLFFVKIQEGISDG